jgi:hypothetical protein
LFWSVRILLANKFMKLSDLIQLFGTMRRLLAKRFISILWLGRRIWIG